jgi:hypothetical protein
MSTVLGEVKQEVISHFSESNVHGLANIVNSKNIIGKIFWTVFVFIFLGITFYQIESTVLKSSSFCVFSSICQVNLNQNAYFLKSFRFLEYSVVSTFKTIHEPSSDFPVVLACLADPLTKDKIINSGPTPAIPENDTSILGVFSAYNKYNGPRLAQIWSNLSMTAPETLRAVLNPINQTVVSCLFDLNFCNASSFTNEFNAVYGQCMRIDIGKRATKPGAENGMQLDIMIDSPNKANVITPYRGLELYIFNRSVGTIVAWQKRISIPAGRLTNIDVNMI